MTPAHLQRSPFTSLRSPADKILAIWVASSSHVSLSLAWFDWVSDRFGAQLGWANSDHQVCLAHLIRDAQYAVDAGDITFAPRLCTLLQRACAIGRRRPALATLRTHRYKLDAELDALLRSIPTHTAGDKLQQAIEGCRRFLFTFLANRAIPPTTTAPSERCGPASSSARSPTASARNGPPTSTPTSAPSSKPPVAEPSASRRHSGNPERLAARRNAGALLARRDGSQRNSTPGKCSTSSETALRAREHREAVWRNASAPDRKAKTR